MRPCAPPESLFSSLFLLHLALRIAGTPQRFLGFVVSLIYPGFFFRCEIRSNFFYLARKVGWFAMWWCVLTNPSCLWAKKTHMGWTNTRPEEPVARPSCRDIMSAGNFRKKTRICPRLTFVGKNEAYQVPTICLSATWRSRRWRGRWWRCYSQQGWQTAWPGDILVISARRPSEHLHLWSWWTKTMMLSWPLPSGKFFLTYLWFCRKVLRNMYSGDRVDARSLQGHRKPSSSLIKKRWRGQISFFHLNSCHTASASNHKCVFFLHFNSIKTGKLC